ncbi:hypothetical protein BSLA_01r5807 [Burkholderia stabilis]|nr:hypothetical protein BSLA_01r5807 [Burkholderia stabilis]
MPPGPLFRLRGGRRGRRSRGLHRHTGKQSRDYSCPVRPVLTRGLPAGKPRVAVSSA